MTITNGYCTLAEVKARLNITSTNSTRDGFIEQMVEAASRWIDAQCGRRFYAATETHYFTPQWADWLMLDEDLISVTTLKTDDNGDRVFETTWTTGDYDLEPLNAAYAVPPGPYTSIRVTPKGDYSFPVAAKSVEIVGSWGYASSAPDLINEACMLKATQLYQRRFGSAAGGGSTTTGQSQPPSDSLIKELLEPFKRLL